MVRVFLDVCRDLVLLPVCVNQDGQVLTVVSISVSAQVTVTLVRMGEDVWIQVDHLALTARVLW